MDVSSVSALITGLIALIIAGSIFALTGSNRLPTLPTGQISISSMLFSSMNTVGGWVPYTILVGGPIADIYYQKFKYSVLSIIAILSMVVGFVFQIVLHGKGSTLPALTVGAVAALTYLVQDAWVEPISSSSKIGTTVGGVIGILLSALVSSRAGMFNTSIMNDFTAVLLGVGLGELAWVIAWNTDKSILPLA